MRKSSRLRTSNSIHTIFRDVLYCTIGVLVTYLFITMIYVNPVSTEVRNTMNGDLIVTVVWPDGNNDVDLWLRSPKDNAIGFTNKSGSIWNLLRDDTGTHKDILPLNYENAFARGKAEGNYIVNVHCYRCSEPIEVVAKLEGKNTLGGLYTIAETKIILNPSEQITLWNFDIDGSQKIININDVQVDILSKRKAQ